MEDKIRMSGFRLRNFGFVLGYGVWELRRVERLCMWIERRVR